MKKPIELNKIKEACDEYLYHIAIRASRGAREKNKIVADYYEKIITEVSKCIPGVSYPEDLKDMRVRIVTPDNKFAYTRFGNFFFVGDCMYIISNDKQFAKYHNPEVHNVDERLAVLNDSTTCTIQVLFAGIYTGIKDRNGEQIFTGDIVQAGYNIAGVDIMMEDFQHVYDNHCLRLFNIESSEIKPFERISTVFYDLRRNEPELNIRNRCNLLAQYMGDRKNFIEFIKTHQLYCNKSEEHAKNIDNINQTHHKKMKLTINELLKLRGITEKNKVKFIRHKFSDSKDGVDFYDPEIGRDVKLESFVTIEDFYRNRYEDFKKYQNTQLTSNFKDVKFIVSFIAESGTRARFVGVYKLEGKPIELKATIDGKSRSYYNFVETDILSDLKERMIINWGESTISWHQWLADTEKEEDKKKEKEILMIGDPLGDLPFPGYMDFTLTRQELERVFEFEYKEWKNALMAVNCIYLITDNNTGKHYVGSTYNTEGIWGRWGCYATKIHGNNKELIKLIKQEGENYRYNLQYTILQILPLNISPKEAIHREEIYKNKLGTKVHGLNLINQKKSN